MIELVGRIKPVAIDIKRRITAVSKSNKSFNIQLDESTHVDKSVQCVVYVRYTAVDYMRKDILFCTRISKTKSGEDIS